MEVRPSAPAPARRAPGPRAPSSTTTTLPPAFQVPAENLLPSPAPVPLPWTPPSTAPPVIHTIWTPAPGVETTPPYIAPTVESVKYLDCTRLADPDVARWTVRVQATLTGGRYWQFPGQATGNTAIFELNLANIVGQPADPNGFDSWIWQLPVRLPSDAAEQVQVWPQVKYHCSPS